MHTFILYRYSDKNEGIGRKEIGRKIKRMGGKTAKQTRKEGRKKECRRSNETLHLCVEEQRRAARIKYVYKGKKEREREAKKRAPYFK